MRVRRVFAPFSAILALSAVACVALAACTGDDTSGTTTDGGGTPDASQPLDTGTVDSSPAADASGDSAPADGAALDASLDSPSTDASTSDASTTDAPTSDSADGATADGGGDDASDAADAAPSSVVPCSSGTIPTATIMVGGNAEDTFTPTMVTINVGDTVQWTWAADGHSVTSVPTATSCNADGTFCSPSDTNCVSGATSDMGATYCQQFTAAGTFNFVCIPHCFNGMRGSVVVQ
jgi:plastocyanin